MPNSIEEIREGINRDYNLLCKDLGLSPVPLDIYVLIWFSKDKSNMGTCFGNGTPLYDKFKIVLPLIEDNIPDIDFESIIYPPQIYKYNTKEWPDWRVDLWHETCHQLQDKIINKWNPNDGREGHSEGWDDAKNFIANALKIQLKQINEIITP